MFDDIQKQEFYTEKSAAENLHQVLSGLAHIHSRNIIHRDLKPENLLLTDSNVIKIADFGLAIDVSFTDGTGTAVCGTENYMAPELIRHETYSFGVDIWAIGIIGFIFLFGYQPFYQDEVCEKELDFPIDDSYQSISGASKSLLRQLLDKSADSRICAEKALHSTWLADLSSVNDSNLAHTVEQITHFNARRRLKTAIKVVLASRKMAQLAKNKAR